MVCINQIPVLNVFDLTKRSQNFRKIRAGEPSLMDDLEFAILPDEKIKEHDLVAIELEVNKKKRKLLRA